MKKGKLLKPSLFVCLILVLAVVSLMVACAEPEPTPTPAPTPTPTPTPTPSPAPPEVIKLKFSHHEPPVTVNHKIYEEWVQKINEQTEGRVEIEIFPAAALAGPQDFYTSLVGGIHDIAAVLSPFGRDQFPLSGILNQPMAPPPYQEAVQIWTELYNKFPEMRSEFDEVELLFTWVPGTTNLHTTGKEIKVPDDIRGMKMLSESSSNLEIFAVSGATPVFMVITESYMALERGLGEGIAAPYDALRVFGLTELTKHHLEISLGVPQCWVIMNKDKWNSISPGDQKIIMDLSPWASDAVCNAKRQELVDVHDEVKGLGHTIHMPTPEEVDLWLDVSVAAAEKWIVEQEANGRPARALYEEAKRLSDQYR